MNIFLLDSQQQVERGNDLCWHGAPHHQEGGQAREREMGQEFVDPYRFRDQEEHREAAGEIEG